MSELNDKNNMKEPFDFATLDDRKDVDADTNSAGGKLGELKNPFDGLPTGIESWTLPLCLVTIWFVMFLAEFLLTGVSAKGLSHWPVIMGSVSHIVLLRSVSATIGHFALTHGFVGLLLGMLFKIASVVVLAFCAVVAMCMHASWGHLLVNIFVFLLLCGVLFGLQVPLRIAVRKWFVLSFAGICATWLSFEVLSFLLQFVAKHPSWLWEISHSVTPIVGASVGIYGLLGFTLMQTVRHLRQAWWVQLCLIFVAVLTVALLYARWASLADVKFVTSSGSALLLSVIMHYVAFVLGCLHGIRMRLPINGR